MTPPPPSKLRTLLRARVLTETLTRRLLRTLTKKRLLWRTFYPDLPIPAFFVFLAFFVLRFSLLFGAFFYSFPRILSADCKRGRKKGAARKMSKSVEKLFDTF